jgi:hypothetical protein
MSFCRCLPTGTVRGMDQSVTARTAVLGGAVVGWIVSVLAAMPVAMAIAIALTGWERPPNTMSDPLEGEAGLEIILTWAGFVIVLTALWILLVRWVNRKLVP